MTTTTTPPAANLTRSVPAPTAEIAGFAAGAAILTTEGLIRVEHLVPGAIAILADGAAAEITAIRRQKFTFARHPSPETIRPVRIQRGALGAGLPTRPLTLAPDHALLLDNVLVQAKHLIDNATILQDKAIPAIEYFSVELAVHGILLAHGAGAESQPRHAAIAPLCQGGPRLAAIRARLRAHAKAIGLTAVETLALAARAQHQNLTPLLNTRAAIAFDIPPGARELLISTPTSAPADFDPASADRRKRGLAITAIIVDHQTFLPEDLAISGLHPRAGGEPHAWTTGPLRLKLPTRTHRVELRLAARPKTWRFCPKAA